MFRISYVKIIFLLGFGVVIQLLDFRLVQLELLVALKEPPDQLGD
jgi:hypothetical protein